MRAALLSVVAFAVIGSTGCPGSGSGSGKSSPASVPSTDDEKTLYALGLSIGQNLQVFDLSEKDMAMVERGLEDQVFHRTPSVQLREYGPKIGMLARARSSKAAEAEKQKGATYLAQAEKEAGAVKLPSGVVYIEQKAGTGEQPVATSHVKVNYRGTLVDGTEFDSSYKRNAPAEFPLNGVVRCWTEGLQKMKVGGKAKLICPSDTAYGDQGRPGIPGGATLTFEVELLEVQAPPAAPAPGVMPPMPGGHPAVPPPPPPAPAPKPVSK
jgi:FKBP-type peptidyl-prolyl cis-trans isomerase FkpA